MDPATIALISTILQLVIQTVPSLVSSATTALDLMNKGTDLTDEERRRVMDALAASESALKAAIAAKGG